MNIYKFIFFSILYFTINSCSTKKDILYLQDNDSIIFDKFSYVEHKFVVDDVLKIEIAALDPLAAAMFKFSPSQSSLMTTKESMIYNGYLVNTDGYITFPIIGKIKIIGLTITEVKTLITDMVKNGGFLTDPTVDVKHLNPHFTILGEVNLPGKYSFLKNNLNILEAFGIAGDLTINGNRNDVRLIRDNLNNKSITSIDLTNSGFLKNNFQIFSGDIIIVNPNTNRIKNAGIIGNSGTLLSLFSFILSSIILTTN